MDSLGFSRHRILQSENKDSFTYIFLLWMSFNFFLSFFCLIALASPVQCWIAAMNVGFLVLFLILVGAFSAFHYWKWCLLWVFKKYHLLCRNFPSICSSVSIFLLIIRGVRFCQMCFLCQLRWSLMWCITLIDFLISDQLCIYKINFT